MDLCIFISSIERILNINEVLKVINKPGKEYLDILDSDLKVNQRTLVKVQKYLDIAQGFNYMDLIERIYFGSETCEVLLPGLADFKKAYEYCQEHEYGFTIVTPYGGPRMFLKLKEIFNYFSDKEDIEVVVNDFGTLQLVTSEYPALAPVLGRLLVKLKRDPRFSISGYEISNKKIKNKAKVEKNQNMALQNSSFENSFVRSLLNRIGVSRLSVDGIPQGFNKKNIKRWKLPVDVFWPWTYITSGRNCAIAAHTDSSRAFHITEKHCQKQCEIYEFNFESDKSMFQTVQRGNTIWMNAETIFENITNSGMERLVYQPYIPI